MTETEIRRARILDLLYDFESERPGEIPGAVDLLGGVYDPQEEHIWRGVLRGLEAQGLIKLAETMGFEGTGAMITDSGRQVVEVRRARRVDPAHRNIAARDAVVRFLYAQPNHEAREMHPLLTSPLASFEGDMLRLDDIDAALVYLKRKYMIDGISVAEQEAVLRPRLTDRGIDCAEQFGGSVADYVSAARSTGPRAG